MISSVLVLLALLNHFGGARALDDRLSIAFTRFDMWCKATGRSTSMREWSKQKFGMTQAGFLVTCVSVSCPHPLLRNTFPTSIGGKAYDTGLALAWVEDDLSHPLSQAENEHCCLKNIGG